MKAINTLLAVVVSLLIACGVFEAGLRLIGLGPPQVLNQFDENLGWSKQPGRSLQRKTAEFDVTFELNGLGLRDDADLTVKKPADTYRVLALGDSFTLGYTVEREDLFVDQIEAAWNAEGRKIQVVNVGSEGYSTDQEVAWLEAHGKDWQPDLVLLFSYDNDIFYNGETHYLRFPKPRYEIDGTLEARTLEDPGDRGFFRQTALGNLLMSKERLKKFEPAASEGATWSEFAPLFNERPDFIADAEARTAGALKGLARVAGGLGCEVIVVPIPSHSSVDEGYAETFTTKYLAGATRGDWDPDRPVQLILDAAQSAGLATLDPRDALRAASASDDLYFTEDFHLNAAGNRAFANFLLAHLDSVAASLPAKVQEADLSTRVASSGSGGLPGFLPWYLGLWLIVGCMYATYYKADEKPVVAFFKVGALLAVIFTIAVGGSTLIGMLSPDVAMYALLAVVATILGFVAYKLGDRISTIVELIVAFVVRGHWYLMPMVVVLLTVGSLLVVAASSPLVAPFIYTLF